MLSPAPWVQRPVAAALTSCATSGSSGSTWAPARLRLLDDQPKYPRRSAHVAAGALLAGGGVVGSMGATLFFGGRRSRTSRRNSKRALQRRAAQGNAEGGVGSSSVGRTTRAAGSACRMMFANNDRCVTLDPSVKQAVEDRLTEYVAGTGKAKDGKYEEVMAEKDQEEAEAERMQLQQLLADLEAENTVLQSQLQQSDGDLDAAPERAPPRDIVSIAPLTHGPEGQALLVSSEDLAAEIAGKMGALKLVYVTRGQQLVDMSHAPGRGALVKDLQVETVADVVKDLREADGPSAPRLSSWQKESVRQLQGIVAAVSATGHDGGGARAGHLVDPTPGALLQEFFTSGGSGTTIVAAQRVTE
eukprot:TRINITY_DN3061_c0_g1_i5.p1 TRINITY_DN3061_c0_g1~~TRINITY_DN3061_c0_g1_i5.p1  ORF type:complete len:359 (-),score=79.51 TRINITY_DN3061_c0_g1_i5:199-1275(-)